MRYFFVDFENVTTHGLEGLTKLTESDEVKIYYSHRNQTISFDLHIIISKITKAKIKYFKLDEAITEKNAIDTKIKIDATSIMDTKSDGLYLIVSKDKGYDAYIEKKKTLGFEISRISQISEASKDIIQPKADEQKVTTPIDSATTDSATKSQSNKSDKVSTSSRNKNDSSKKAATSATNEKAKAATASKRLMDKKAFTAFLETNLKQLSNENRTSIIKAYLDSKIISDFHNKLMKTFKNKDLVKSIYGCEAIKKNKNNLFKK